MKHVVKHVLSGLGFTASAVAMLSAANPFLIVPALVCWHFIEEAVDGMEAESKKN